MMRPHSLVLALMGATLALTITTNAKSPYAVPSAADDVQVINVTAKKYEFNPSPIQVKAGTRVQLRITATDRAHGFKISEFPEGVDDHGKPGLIFSSPQDCWKLEKNQPLAVEFVAQIPGTYAFKCCVHCGLHHGSMKGELIVVP